MFCSANFGVLEGVYLLIENIAGKCYYIFNSWIDTKWKPLIEFWPFKSVLIKTNCLFNEFSRNWPWKYNKNMSNRHFFQFVKFCDFFNYRNILIQKYLNFMIENLKFQRKWNRKNIQHLQKYPNDFNIQQHATF